MASRSAQIANHLSPNAKQRLVTTKRANDAVIVSAVRTPFCKMRKGGLATVKPELLLAAVLKEVVARANIDKTLVEDIAVGNVLQSLGGGAKAARMAALHAGLPIEASLYTINRQCSSSAQAVANVANAIKLGDIQCGIGAGVESMTFGFGEGTVPKGLSEEITSSWSQDCQDCMLPMGITSERVASRYGVSRQDQDEWSAISHARGAAAQEKGYFDDEIVPVPVHKDGKTTYVSKDDGIRKETTADSLAKLKPSFDATGSSTAGNSSQTTDGASAVLLMRRDLAEELGLKILARFETARVMGVKPDEMGVGPVYSSPKLLSSVGLTVDDVDLWELNEAFASQFLYCIRTLGISPDKVNVAGGAIAIGHPLAATGAAKIGVLIRQLERTGGHIGVVTMCCGSGFGFSGLVIRE